MKPNKLVFTLRAATGQIVKVETVDSAGKRHEVPTDEAVELAGKDNMKGIETAEDLRRRRELLTLIIGSEVRRPLLRRLAGRLILTKKIESKG